jgi:hypothetical protein
VSFALFFIEASTIQFATSVDLFQLEKTEFGLNVSLKVKDLCQRTERVNQLMMVCLQLDASKSMMNTYPLLPIPPLPLREGYSQSAHLFCSLKDLPVFSSLSHPAMRDLKASCME